MTQSPVAQMAANLGLPTIKTNVVDDDTLGELGKFKIDMAIVVAFGVLLKKEALESITRGWFNVHYSLLPRWRGAAPVQHALLAGDQTTGVTIFKIDEGLDTGEVVGQVPTKIEVTENAGTLLRRLTKLGISLLLEVLPKIESGFHTFAPQNNSESTQAPKLGRAHAHINIFDDSKVIENQVRACNPEPGAWIEFSSSELKIHEAYCNPEATLKPGQLEMLNGRVLLGCAKGCLELIEVQPAGKSRMAAGDWFRGTTSGLSLGVHV